MAEDSPRLVEGEKVADTLLDALEPLKTSVMPVASAVENGSPSEMRVRLAGKVGDTLAARIVELNLQSLATTILSIQ